MPSTNNSMACYGESLQVVIDEAYCFEYINSATEPVSTAPPNWWWVVIAGISALTEIINPVFIKLQAQNLLISMQSVLLETLSLDICTMIGIQGPFSNEELVRLTGEFNVVYGR